MLYEMRIYHAAEGKLQPLCDRFEHGTMEIFRSHDIEVTDFFVDEAGQRLFYICAFANEAEQTAKWDAFVGDEAWVTLKRESEIDGPLVASIESVNTVRAPFFRPGAPGGTDGR